MILIGSWKDVTRKLKKEENGRSIIHLHLVTGPVLILNMVIAGVTVMIRGNVLIIPDPSHS